MLIHTDFSVSLGGVNVTFPRNSSCTIITGEKDHSLLISIESKLQNAKISHVAIYKDQTNLAIYKQEGGVSLNMSGKKSDDFKRYGIEPSSYTSCKYVLISGLGDKIKKEYQKTVLSWLKSKLPDAHLIITTTSESVLGSEKPENIFRLNQ